MTDWVRLTGDKGTAELGDGELLLILLFELEEKLCDFVLIGVVLLLWVWDLDVWLLRATGGLGIIVFLLLLVLFKLRDGDMNRGELCTGNKLEGKELCMLDAGWGRIFLFFWAVVSDELTGRDVLDCCWSDVLILLISFASGDFMWFFAFVVNGDRFGLMLLLTLTDFIGFFAGKLELARCCWMWLVGDGIIPFLS